MFQHGREHGTHAHIAEAAKRVAPGGLFCIRVNAAGTDISHAHEVIERNDEGGFTIEYLSGPKVGLHIHFFAHDELVRLLSGFRPVLPLRIQSTQREPPQTGRWLQWEGIWCNDVPQDSRPR